MNMDKLHDASMVASWDVAVHGHCRDPRDPLGDMIVHAQMRICASAQREGEDKPSPGRGGGLGQWAP